MTKKRASKYGSNRVYNVTFADLASFAALTGNVKLFSLPQGAIITDTLIKPKVAFVGPTTVTARVTTAQHNYGTAFDVKQAVAAETFDSDIVPFREKLNSVTDVNLSFVSTGTNLNTTTAGEVDVVVNYVLRGVA
jgi:hypothetical protein